jgi:hypothetical protein
MIYTKSNAARTLGQLYNRVQWMQEFWKVINVCVKGFRPVFVSKKAFRQAFVEFRKESASTVQVKRLGVDSVHFQALGRDEIYDVTLKGHGVTCTCVDYQNQVQYIPGAKHCCKHGYAVLSRLGFGSLQDYLAYNR